MKTEITGYITKTSHLEWTQLIEEGVCTQGVSVKILRFDEQQQRAPTILLRFEPGATYPYHNHSGGEEIFAMQGSCFVNEIELHSGDYLYTPPGFKHNVRTKTGCELMLVIPEEVEILEK